MSIKKNGALILMALCIGACSESKNPKYKDTSLLEKPPVMPIVAKQKDRVEESEEEQDEKKGLGDNIILTEFEQKPIIKIKKNFDLSWNFVEQALQLKDIEISDKNREKGIYYVTFDPDEQSDSTLADAMTFFLFKDDYAEAAYKLTVKEKATDNSEIIIEHIATEENDLMDDDGDDFDGTIDEGVMLMNTLYKTIRDELEIE
jgi:hypothetical protein